MLVLILEPRVCWCWFWNLGYVGADFRTQDMLVLILEPRICWC